MVPYRPQWFLGACGSNIEAFAGQLPGTHGSVNGVAGAVSEVDSWFGPATESKMYLPICTPKAVISSQGGLYLLKTRSFCAASSALRTAF